MVAFAANSVLNRLALANGEIDPISFANIRLMSGAITLALLALTLRGNLRLLAPFRIVGVATLLLYIFGFSVAYVSLDAGLGALILFGVVQITMFSGGLLTGERPPVLRWTGAALAFAGLAWLLWPSENTEISLLHAGFMALAGIGWGLYSLAGRKESDALQGTAANFIFAAPIGIALVQFLPTNLEPTPTTMTGILLAIVSGGITSGLGYALWYAILPKIQASLAAVAQLTVPIIATAGGIVFIGETMTLRFALATGLVLGGVALSALAGRK